MCDDKCAVLVIADLAGSRREADYSQKELAIQRQEKNMLQSKVDSLKSRMALQKKELADLEGDAKAKLSSAGAHAKQSQQEISSLRAKVSHAVWKPKVWLHCNCRKFCGVKFYQLKLTCLVYS